MELDPSHLAAFIIAVCFAAGLNVYATVASLGLAARFGYVVLPDALQPIADWWVIAGAGVSFAAEFVADKIAIIDLVWNMFQTVVRVPAAAVFAYAAAAPLSPGLQLLAAALGGAIAAAAHGGKIAARTAVTASPEPVSNILLSLGEDAFAIGLTWFATQHPYIAASMVVILMVAIVLFVRWVIRTITWRGRRQKAATVAAARADAAPVVWDISSASDPPSAPPAPGPVSSDDLERRGH